MNFAGKKILVLGAGISGTAVAQILKQQGAFVTLSDAKPAAAFSRDFTELAHCGVELALGRQDEGLLEAIDYVVLSPGVSVYSPLVEQAQTRGLRVISEVEVAYQLCVAPLIAITGTNGKTTTTTLTGEMLKASGRNVVVGGNIGLALSHEVLNADAASWVVAEISSFQLEAIEDFRPHIAAVLNLTPDHIDRHRSMNNYQATKENIFRNQTSDDYLILNYDDPAVREMANRAPGQVLYFSRTTELAEGACLRDDMITINWRGKSVHICRTADIKIKGAHNVENALAACAAAFLIGVDTAAMAQVLRQFPGVEHRIEPAGVVNGVPYYNDSKATNPESAIKALEAFPGHIILIAGGRDKNTDLTAFMQLVKERVDELILIGEAADRFASAAAAQGIMQIHSVSTFTDAVDLAYRLAQPPQVVLLSPACASYDMFNNYEERGRVFKELVAKLA